jgi:hypothetical protein
MAGGATGSALVTGSKEIAKTLRQLATKFPDRVLAALYLEAQIEMTESKRRCPVSPTKSQMKAMGRSWSKNTRPGTLRASGYVAQPERNGRTLSVEIGYGGAAADYAIPQHERLDYQHTTGQAKYLESVLNESRPSMAQRIGARVQLGED